MHRKTTLNLQTGGRVKKRKREYSPNYGRREKWTKQAKKQGKDIENCLKLLRKLQKMKPLMKDIEIIL